MARDADGVAAVESYFDSDNEFEAPRVAPRAKTIKPVLSLDSPAPGTMPRSSGAVKSSAVPAKKTTTDSESFVRPLPVAKKAKKQPRAGDSPYEPYITGYSSGEDEDNEDPLEFESRPASVAGTPAPAQNDTDEDEDDEEEEEHLNASFMADQTPAPRSREDEYEASFVVADDDDGDDDAANDADETSGDEDGLSPLANVLSAGRKRGTDGRVRSRRQVIAPLRSWLGERQMYVGAGENALPRVEVVRVKTPTSPAAKKSRGAHKPMDKEQRRRIRQFEGAASPDVDVGGDQGEELLKVVKRNERLQYAPLGRGAGAAAAVFNAPSGQFAVRSVVLPPGGVLRVNKKTLLTSHSFFVVNGQCAVQMLDEFGDLTEFGVRALAHFFVPAGFKGRIENTSQADVRLNHYVVNG